MVRPITQNLRCNEQIRISPIRLIGDQNEQVGIVSLDEALRTAREAGMDLVEVAPRERPPVCRIMDYGRWKYRQKKHIRKHHEQHLKEVRLRPKTDAHDRQIKINRAVEFFRKGNKVQFTMVFRGRERMHRDIGFATLRGIADDFGERVKVERPPGMDGRRMVMILAPMKSAFQAEQKADHADGRKQAAQPRKTTAPVDANAPAAEPEGMTSSAPNQG
ncbi:MAG: translation initiation factor IF-3 [Planctomycetes bacterium]|nr:translation initiation factor IF-3 [Planctomycetota bacterium]